MRDLYPVFFKHHHLLPDAVGKQSPRALFALLDSFSEAEENYDYSDNEHLMMFYGR